MNLLQVIKQEEFSIVNNNIQIGTNAVSCSICIDNYPEVVNSIQITNQLIRDSIFESKSKFVNKYQDQLIDNAVLTTEHIYLYLRNIIVDEKITIPKKQSKVSRKQQVKDLLDKGENSPSKIAKIIGANPSYVWTIIKQLGRN